MSRTAVDARRPQCKRQKVSSNTSQYLHHHFVARNKASKRPPDFSPQEDQKTSPNPYVKK